MGAAWLHDVGYAPEVADTGFHPLDGARYLAGLETDERVVNLVGRHSYAILEAEFRGFGLGRPGLRDARVHDARHTAATLLIEQGVHIRVVQEVLGPTRVTTTESYTHVTMLQMRDASERISEALWGQE